MKVTAVLPARRLWIVVVVFVAAVVSRPLRVLVAAAPDGTTPSHRPAEGPFHRDAVRRLVEARCNGVAGGNACAVWSYEGTLTDPTNGIKIADVEGLELVRHLAEFVNDDDDDDDLSGGGKRRPPDDCRESQERRLGDLAVRRALFPPSASSSSPSSSGASVVEKYNIEQGTHNKKRKEWDYATTILTRRLFCYRDPANPLRPLSSIRLRPDGPKRPIGLRQAVSLYDGATTYISRDGGRELIVVTERNDGGWVSSKCGGPGTLMIRGDSGINDNDDGRRRRKRKQRRSGSNDNKHGDAFEFTTYARLGSGGGTGTDDTFELDPLPDGMAGERGAATTPAVPRSKFVQFGPDRRAERRRYGARESYCYTFGASPSRGGAGGFAASLPPPLRHLLLRLQGGNPSSPHDDSTPIATVRYTRYGECPPWYGPGRMGTLELRGRLCPGGLDEAPPLAASVAAGRVPGFASVDQPVPDDSEAARAVEWFREGREDGGALPLRITEGDESGNGDGATGRSSAQAPLSPLRSSWLFRRARDCAERGKGFARRFEKATSVKFS